MPKVSSVKTSAAATMIAEPSTGSRLDFKSLNDTIRYTMWSVFRVEPGRLGDDRSQAAQQASEFIEALEGKGVIVRGIYDLSGLRADADYMIWWHATDIESVQAAYADLRRETALGRVSEPVWSQVALHRPAEFNKSHIPAFLADEDPKKYVCVYPFVRSHEWYLLPGEERRRMLAEHGMKARQHPDVRASTVASFGLGDYEWLLAFEADELHRIVDLMRLMRETDARRHVREETPFYTGPRRDVADLVAVLP
jgi:chlorite dismutase